MKLVLVLLLTNIFAFSTAAPTRQLVILLFRHGDRSPANVYPTYPYVSAWPQGLGQLTTLGMQEQYELGTFVKQRYIPGYLSAAYRRNETYIRSTDIDRTIMSALAQLSAIFPPSGDQVWNSSIPWQPIPVHTWPTEYDNILRSYGIKCPAYDKSVVKFRKSDDFVNMSRTYRDVFDEISQATKSEVNLSNIWMYFDAQNCDRIHNITLPEWAKKYSTLLAQLNNYDMKIRYAREGILPYMGGRLWWLFWHLVSGKVDKNEGTKVFWLSSHDVTLATFLASLKVWNGLQPPYASMVISELMRDGDRWYFNFYFKNSSGAPIPLSVPGCGSNCSLDVLKKLTKNLTLSQDEWENTCGISAPSSSADLNVLPYIISIGILGFVIVFLCFVWMLTIPWKCRRNAKPAYGLLPSKD